MTVNVNRIAANLKSIARTGARNVWAIAYRSDGYIFYLIRNEHLGAFFVEAGCQYHTINGYREHTKDYEKILGFWRGWKKRRETLRILAQFQAIVDAVNNGGNAWGAMFIERP